MFITSNTKCYVIRLNIEIVKTQDEILRWTEKETYYYRSIISYSFSLKNTQQWCLTS